MSISSGPLTGKPLATTGHCDDLARNVFGIFGVPIDAIDLTSALSEIERAINQRQTMLISTPNVNFLVTSWADSPFRNTLLVSDLCPPDGMPIVWMARLLNIPIKSRVAGADIFQAMRTKQGNVRHPKAFLFGGGDGIAKTVGDRLNMRADGMTCVGAISPGFGSVEEMSGDEIITTINSSQADFLAVFLTAQKGQAWLLKNHDRLDIPVRAQFGTTINFEAGKIKRAPPIVSRIGLEWLWRIKEEPYLWRRYWKDGKELFALFSTCALPLALGRLIRSLRSSKSHLEVRTHLSLKDDKVIVRLKGDAIASFIDDGISVFRRALGENKSIEIDVSQTETLDQRYFGLFLMVRKQLMQRGQTLSFSEMPAKVRRRFSLNRFSYLLTS